MFAYTKDKLVNVVTFQCNFYFYSGLTCVCSLHLNMRLISNNRTEVSYSQNPMNQQREDATC